MRHRKRSVQNTGNAQYERRNFGIKLRATFDFHAIAAVHGADLGCQHRAAGVLETFLRGEYRLFADDPLSAHFLHVVEAVGNHPVAAEQLDCLRAEIGDGDGVGKCKPVAGFIRLVGLVGDAGANEDMRQVWFFHAANLNRFWRASQGPREM